jgi:hypothetical protein
LTNPENNTMNTQTPDLIFTPTTPPAKVAYFQRMLGMDLVVLEYPLPHSTPTIVEHIVSAERLAESLGVDWEVIKTMVTTNTASKVANGYGTICLLHCGIDFDGEVRHPENSGLFIALDAVKALILEIDMAALEQTHTESVRNRIADLKADIRSVQGCHWDSMDPHNAITNSDAQGFAAAKNIFH